MNNNISSLRQKVMLGQAKGAPSGMLGHVAKEGAKALGCIWGTGYFKHITSKHRAPRPAVLSEHCNPTVLLRTMSWVTDPAGLQEGGHSRVLQTHVIQALLYSIQEPSMSRTLTGHGWLLASTPAPAGTLMTTHIPDHAPHSSSMAEGWQGHHSDPQTTRWHHDVRVKLPSK